MYIVTGGAGFIGSQVVRDLIEQGEHVADMPLESGLALTLDWMKTVPVAG